MILKTYLRETARYLLRCPLVIRKHIRHVESLMAMSPDELRRYDERHFVDIVHNAYNNSPFYRRLYDENGVDISKIRSIDDISMLPVITKDMVKRHGLEMLTVLRKKVVAGHTSGTTGTPLTFYRDWNAIRRDYAFVYVVRKNVGFKSGDRLVSMRGILAKGEFKLKVHASNTLYLSSYDINADNIQRYCDEINSFRPRAIEGYPSSLYSLALFMKEKNLRVSVPIIFTSSETLFPNQRELIEDRFGGALYDFYGMSEQVLYLMETFNHEGYYMIPGYSVLELLPDGELCTTLVNRAFPLIRYKANDILEVRRNPELPYGLVVTSILGRLEDFIVTRDGSRVMRLDFVFKGARNVRYAQIVQFSDNTVEVRIVPDSGFSDADMKLVRDNMIEKVGVGNLDFNIVLIDESQLIKSRSGKQKLIVNLRHEPLTGDDLIDNQDLVKPLFGGGKVLVDSIVGRVDDFILARDGSRLTRVDFIESGRNIKACQWVQTVQGELEARIVPDDGFTDADLEFVRKKTLERVGEDNIDLTVRICGLDEMILTSRGKFKLIVNRIENKN